VRLRDPLSHQLALVRIIEPSAISATDRNDSSDVAVAQTRLARPAGVGSTEPLRLKVAMSYLPTVRLV
jgi:hypothetical protein